MTEGQPLLPEIPVVADSAPRLTLVVEKGPQAGAKLPCRRVATLIGSRPGCKIVLAHRHVAPVHLLLVNDGREIKAVDLMTSTGTKLNGLSMQLEGLNDGDVLQVDQWPFKVEIEHPPQEGDADAHPFELEPTPHMVALEVLVGGRLLQPNRDVCLIGRRNGCDIVLSDARVSRAHAVLLTYFGYPAVLDLLTHEGTFVDDQRVAFCTVKDSQILRVGDTRFRIRLVGSTVGDKSSGNHRDDDSETVRLAAEPISADLVNIAETERRQRWQVAEHLDQIEGSGAKR